MYFSEVARLAVQRALESAAQLALHTPTDFSAKGLTRILHHLSAFLRDRPIWDDEVAGTRRNIERARNGKSGTSP